MLIYLPVSAAQILALTEQGLVNPPAFAATDAVLQALDLEPEFLEDAEYIVLQYASVAALTQYPYRCVAVAEVQDSSVTLNPQFACVEVNEVKPSQLRCLFIDGEEVVATAALVHAQVAGLDMSQAWENSTVQELIAQADLLWHDSSEALQVCQILTDTYLR